MPTLAMHPHLRTLFNLFGDSTQLAQAAAAPLTDSFLDRVFIAEAALAGPPVRIERAGEALNQSFGRPVEGEDFLRLFNDRDRTMLWGLLTLIQADRAPALMRLDITDAEGGRAGVELALAPLGRTIETHRWLGLYQPVGEQRLERPVTAQTIVHIAPPRRERSDPALLQVIRTGRA